MPRQNLTALNELIKAMGFSMIQEINEKNKSLRTQHNGMFKT